MPFYAVHRGRQIGIFNTWNECKEQVHKYSNPIYKKFNNKIEANLFVKCGFVRELSIEPTTNENINVYTDGSCINNGKPNAMAGIGIYFGINDSRNISRRIIGSKQTNNVAELTAIITVFSILQKEIKNKQHNIIIHTDSEYSIKCFSSYGLKCKKLNWNKNISNIQLIQLGYTLFNNNPMIDLRYVKAHTNKKDVHSIGNMNADKLANKACKK